MQSNWNPTIHRCNRYGGRTSTTECVNIQTNKSITFIMEKRFIEIEIFLPLLSNKKCYVFGRFPDRMKKYTLYGRVFNGMNPYNAVRKIYMHFYHLFITQKGKTTHIMGMLPQSTGRADINLIGNRLKNEPYHMEEFGQRLCKCKDCHDTILGLFALFRWKRFTKQQKCKKILRQFFETQTFYLFPELVNLIVHWLH